MPTSFLALFIVSFAAAVVFGIIAWRAHAEQRRRSAARVALLASALGAGDSGAEPVPISSLFEKESGAMVRARPWMRTAVAGVLGAALVVFVAVAAGRDSLDQADSPQTAQAGNSATLELMTMRHIREGSGLQVTGLVRNPASGVQMSRISAIVSAFDRDGALIASAQAPLDFTVLGPGDESTFVVTIPDASNVGRYRVTFRDEQGTLRHVDRRTSSRVASNGVRNP